MVGYTHPVDNGDLIEHFLGACGDWLLSAVIMWVVYLALEPEVRSRWPHSIVTWNRLLAGRWRDAQVGSEILLGAAVGAGMWITFKLMGYVTESGGEPVYQDFNLFAVLGARQWVGSHANYLGNALRLGILVFMAVFGLRVLLRKDWLAVIAAAILFTMTEGEVVRSSEWLIITLIYVSVYCVLILLLLRFGLVASITTIFFVNGFSNVTLGTSWKTWYTPSGLATVVLLAGIAIWAFTRSLGGRELIGEE